MTNNNGMREGSLENGDNLELDFERICFLYSASNIGYLGMLIAVSFLAYFVGQLSSFNLAATWMIIVCLSYLPRVVLSIVFNRKLKNDEIKKYNVRRWEKYHFYSSILPFTSFSAVVFFPYGDDAFTGVLFSAFIMIAVMANGFLLYSTSKSIILLFINIAFLFLVARCFWEQDIQFTTLGSFLVITYFFMRRLIFRQSRIILENISLKIENKNQSLTDPLTKLWNRRRLDLYIDKLINISRRNNEPFSIIFLDIDHFKRYNDTHGHNAGDALLIKLADIFIECSRDQDLIIRYGGEEFLIVLPNTNIKQAEIIAERILERIRGSTDVTISAGLATYSDHISFDKLIHEADEALYNAKKTGRNKYTVATATST